MNEEYGEDRIVFNTCMIGNNETEWNESRGNSANIADSRA